MTITTTSQTSELKEMQNQIHDIQRQKHFDRLTNVIIPRELFLREDGSIDLKARDREADWILKQGYPDTLKDDMLVGVYSNILRDLDQQRELAQLAKADAPNPGNLTLSRDLGHSGNVTYDILTSPKRYSKAQ